MTELELFNTFGKESIVFVAIILIWFLFVKPKDEQIKELLESNRLVVSENSETLASISDTMKEISGELTNLNENQVKLKDGQDELWKEIIMIKKER
ncbi:hypothetical protein ACQKOK_28280 [Bacillus cereus]|jgi:hypothetical protein|uniref:hypothetical protein n=1 Tax=Bacillus cereus group TaxID=86661 RepID=UPI000BEBDE44|nr:hypothetical protein [Bacillus cereus]PDY93270.1 hypothetical protein CON09_08580 [Bacillus anthracis]PFB17014.1 hypothetical protein CN399_08640 [Bacillus cereus]PGS22345.1 hypothetical protein COC59_20295 [Bacillus cereus]